MCSYKTEKVQDIDCRNVTRSNLSITTCWLTKIRSHLSSILSGDRIYFCSCYIDLWMDHTDSIVPVKRLADYEQAGYMGIC